MAGSRAACDLLPDAAGMNRFAWDLRVEDPQQIPGRSTPTKARATAGHSGTTSVA